MKMRGIDAFFSKKTDSRNSVDVLFQHLDDCFRPYRNFFELEYEILDTWLYVAFWLLRICISLPPEYH